MVKKAIIYVPGLNDNKFLNRTLTNLLPYFWGRFGYEIFIVRLEWNKGKSFSPKLALITNKIDELTKRGYTIFLLGQSAGGAAVLNAFTERKDKVCKAVNICGRLREGKNVFPTLENSAIGNPAFAKSVFLFENKNERKLLKNDRKKILTIKPIWDDVVPSSTVPLSGATNITIPMIQHSIGGISVLTIFFKKIITFFSAETSLN